MRKQLGPKQNSDLIENYVEQGVNDILDLYFTEDEADDDSGNAASHQLRLLAWSKGTSPKAEATDSAPAVPVRNKDRNRYHVPPVIPPAQPSGYTPSRRTHHSRLDDQPPQREEPTLSTRARAATIAALPRVSFLRQQALFSGDCPQSPGSRRWNGSVEERRETNSGARLPVTYIDEFGNTWI